MTESLGSFCRDTRGAIAMTGVIALPVVAACAWYELVVAKQTLLREAAQSQADSIAALGAGTLASGMNVLAMINVIMAIVLSVFIAIRVLEILGIAGAIFFTALSFIPFMQWAEAIATRSAQVAQDAFVQEQRVAPKIMRALVIASKGERWIARGFPYVSSALSLTVAQAKTKMRGFGIAGNMSLTPTAIDRTLSKLTSVGTSKIPLVGGDLGFPKRMGAIEDDAGTSSDGTNGPLKNTLASLAKFSPMDMIGSLPVEAEGYPQICSRAAGDWQSLPGISKVPFLDKLGTVLSFIGGNFTALLCQPLSDAESLLEKAAADQTKSAVNAKAESVVRAGCEADVKAGRFGKKTDTRSDEDKLKGCIKGRAGNWKGSQEGKDFAKKFKQEQLDKARKLKNEPDTDNIETAKLWSLVTDGGATASSDVDEESEGTIHGVALPVGSTMTKLAPNVFMNSWSIYQAPPSRDETAVDFKAIAALTGGAVDEQSAPIQAFQPDWSSAKARMYFDCGAKDVFKRSADDHGIHSCADNSLWRPGAWHWDLAVDRSLDEEAKSTATQALAGYIGWLTGELAQKTLGLVLGKAVGRFPDNSAANSGSSSGTASKWNPLGIWRDRMMGTANGTGVKGSLGNNHALDWWLGNNAGSAVEAQLNGEPAKYQKYLR